MSEHFKKAGENAQAHAKKLRKIRLKELEKLKDIIL